LGAIEPELAALGVRLVFIGNGEPAYARDFQAERHVTAPLYVSPDLSAYAAFDFNHGVGSTLSPGALGHAARALLGGFRQGPTRGAPFQQGGVALVLPDGRVPYLYRSGEAGDHPSTAAVLAAVKAAIARED